MWQQSIPISAETCAKDRADKKQFGDNSDSVQLFLSTCQVLLDRVILRWRPGHVCREKHIRETCKNWGQNSKL